MIRIWKFDLSQKVLESREWDSSEIVYVDRKESSRHDVHFYSYFKERAALKKLIQTLYEKNEDEFESEEEVFNLFAKAAISGRLLPVARLIEKTFGKGSFRELGEETAKRKQE